MIPIFASKHKYTIILQSNASIYILHCLLCVSDFSSFFTPAIFCVWNGPNPSPVWVCVQLAFRNFDVVQTAQVWDFPDERTRAALSANIVFPWQEDARLHDQQLSQAATTASNIWVTNGWPTVPNVYG